MKQSCKIALITFIIVSISQGSFAQGQESAAFQSSTLTEEGDLSSLMVEGIHQFLRNRIDETNKKRFKEWKKNLSDNENIQLYFQEQRAFLRSRLGIADQKETPKMNVLTDRHLNQKKYESNNVSITAVRWNVLEKLNAEGLLLQPKSKKVVAKIVLIPDADTPPEVLAGLQDDGRSWTGLGYKLAKQGYEVIIPVLVNRKDTYSGNELIDKYTNQPHREWLYRKGFELGRHIIGYELQKVFSAIDWFENHNKDDNNQTPIGVMGYGEGGLLALNAGALDQRIASTLISGYFNRTDSLWKEPIYRNTFGTLQNIGNAELAVMHWPRSLVVEHSTFPQVDGPPPATDNRAGAAPGRIITPPFDRVKKEWSRTVELLSPREVHGALINTFDFDNGVAFSSKAILAFTKGLNLSLPKIDESPFLLPDKVGWANGEGRQRRVIRNMEEELQNVFKVSERTRDSNFWEKLKGENLRERDSIKAAFRGELWDVLGRLPSPSVPANPRGRLLKETRKWKRYEVVLDVWSGVFAWGILTIPKNIKKGEKLPVVVAQHGLEGLPKDVVITDPNYEKFGAYKGFATKLAEQGYVTFAPHNPYRGGDKFRELQRMANPIGYSLFSIIIGQHQRILEWLSDLDMVDPKRIGFYGLSYGGKTAMRVPAVLTDYALSICSGDFNAWIRKNVSTDLTYSYMFTNEYEMPEWNLAHTYSYAEMAALIAPRPFMVERGHSDGVGDDEWVAYEYAKVRRYYDRLGIGDRTTIEFFNGPHEIHGVGTFQFLHKYLKVPQDNSK